MRTALIERSSRITFSSTVFPTGRRVARPSHLREGQPASIAAALKNREISLRLIPTALTKESWPIPLMENQDPYILPMVPKSLISAAESSNGVAVYVMNADGTGQTRISPFFDIEDTGKPTWSPDGTRIAFAANLFGGFISELFVINADGTGLAQLTDNNLEPF